MVGHLGLDAQALQHGTADLLVHGLILDHQDPGHSPRPDVRERRQLRMRIGRCGRRCSHQRQTETETGPPCHGVQQFQPALHALRQAPADAQSQARPGMQAVSGLIGLHKGFENALALIRCDARAGVADREDQFLLCLRRSAAGH